MRYKHPIILFLFLLLFGCSQDPIITKPEELEKIVVLSLISPAFETQEAYVGKSLPEYPPSDISGAEVFITGSQGTYRLEETQPGIYRDLDHKLKVKTGETYFLWVRVPNGKVVKARTTVPGGFHITNISETDTLSYIRVFTRPDSTEIPLIAWTRSEGAVIYQAFVRFNDHRVSPSSQVTLDTLSLFPSLFSFKEITTYLSVTLYVFAYDSAYSRYCNYWMWRGNIPAYSSSESHYRFEEELRNLSLDQRSNIEGGLGVFGSASVTSMRLTIKFTQRFR